ncbi:hypothetical protein CIHG_09775 [Coccidioides immitis H538.4]|uniref:Uncharacterized protein n=3 Tax=Coccidioides immitis TaxID=5501 RepID=A0A0J8TNA3_COCIT|nr:hypothetical protein CIRG_06611 [Coccidioides immitis RMSCC 2394]KMU75182.1 hypothetical protein CISG_04131 [Coccidioides immitis RMSCC 3703]KMU92005.1 hypothetical protein CIHG_09775 [Coccidioides immitis H538.4]
MCGKKRGSQLKRSTNSAASYGAGTLASAIRRAAAEVPQSRGRLPRVRRKNDQSKFLLLKINAYNSFLAAFHMCGGCGVESDYWPTTTSSPARPQRRADAEHGTWVPPKHKCTPQ